MKKIIIDCDAGVDDALALILAFHSPELEIKAVTAVSGNVPLETVFGNIQKVLSIIQPRQRPLIARGADRPLKGEAVYAHSVHGEDGLGGSRIERREGEEWWQIFPGRADELIPEMARQYPGEMTLIAIAPLTNLALGLQKDPQGMKQLKEVVIMGGAVRTKGNITPYAEFNIFVDPLAAQRVFTSGLPITLVPLDVTHQVFLSPRIIEERVRLCHYPFPQFVIEATGYHSAGFHFRGGMKVFHLHDPLAVGVIVDPNLVSKERLSITVETEPGEFYGRALEVAGERASGSQNMDVCLGVKSEDFLELFLSRLGP
jgi:purine nucleosidase